MGGAAVAAAVDLQLLLHVLDGHHGGRRRETEEASVKGGKVQKVACGKTCTLSGLEMWQAGGEQFRGKPFNLPTPPTTSLRDRYRYRGRAHRK